MSTQTAFCLAAEFACSGVCSADLQPWNALRSQPPHLEGRPVIQVRAPLSKCFGWRHLPRNILLQRHETKTSILPPRPTTVFPCPKPNVQSKQQWMAGGGGAGTSVSILSKCLANELTGFLLWNRMQPSASFKLSVESP